MHKLYVRLLFLLFVALVASGCLFGRKRSAPEPVQAGPPPAPTLALTLVGAPGMNNGNAMRVRVYQLLNDTAFRQARRESFWTGAGPVLGDELVERQEVLLYPNETRQLEIKLSDEVQFVAVAADFYQPDQENWRAIFPKSQLLGGTLRITLETDRLTDNR